MKILGIYCISIVILLLLHFFSIFSAIFREKSFSTQLKRDLINQSDCPAQIPQRVLLD